MNVAITTLVTPPTKIGIGNYVVNLVHALQRVDRQNRYFVFVGPDTRHLFNFSAPNFYPIVLPFTHDPRWLMRPLYFAWQNTLAGFYCRQHQIDVMHLPNLLPLIVRHIPTVITIPDLAEFSTRRYATVRQQYRRMMLLHSSKKADRVIAISNHTKQDLVRFAGIDDGKIDVTYLASCLSPQSFIHLETMGDESLADTPSYILYVGNTLPHKNLKRVIEAYAILHETHHISHRLLLVGPKDSTLTEIMALAGQLRIDKHIDLLGYVDDTKLAKLYRNAALFVFPSLSEGFGLPVLEAMTMGAPVVTSNVSSLPEVAGDAAILVDPENPHAIADGMWAIIGNDSLRSSLVEKGKRQASKFTWEKCALETIAAYYKTAGHDHSSL
ncbi:MAG: glycosyltransferase family 4 protein [Caldilineaceae bacterium]|nr:glycosyltransferase family 4 protein [Caldilineaceae bacterium]